jgi:CelD/BcsL family acetyltransferase involved in cellulose biosynthesis
MAVIHSNRIWEIKIGYDERYAKCSPGILLTHETLRYTFEKGYSGYEFLGQEEAWERMWANKRESYVSMHVYPYTSSGVGMLIVDVASFAAGKIRAYIKSMSCQLRQLELGL